MVLVFTTVCWSLGIASVLPAFAATISAGDLIKASGAAVYYYGADGMRYVFPNEATYKSWYADFSAVKTITDAELAAIEMNGNATVRPGTKLVKITTDPKTYAVTPGGVLRHIDSEARAVTLFGTNWASKIVDVSDAFWVNYKKGAIINSDINPDGSLVKYAGSDTIYLIEDGMKRAISSAAFTANRYSMMNVVTISDSITYSNGSALTSLEAELVNVAGGANAGGGSTTGGGLTVALASDTPTSGIAVGNAARVPFTKINLTATGGDVIVDQITIQRTGLGNDNAFSSLDIIDTATGMPINTTSKTLNSSHQATFTGDFTVKSGTTMGVLVTANMAASLASYAGEVPSITIVEVKANGSVSGNLPITGNYQNINGTITIGTATIDDGAYHNVAASVEVGKTDYTVFAMKVSAGSAEAVSFNQLKLYESGSATLGTDVTNIKLFRDGTKLADGMVDGKYVSFSFSPLTLDKGASAELQVKADVADGSARTIILGIYKTTDFTVTGGTYNYNITPSYTAHSTYSASSPIITDSTFTISNGTLTVSKSNTVGATDITVANDQIIGAFQFTVKGEPIDITALTLTIASSSTGNIEDALTNVALINSAGVVVAGPVDVTNNALTAVFSDTFTAPVGDNVYRVKANLATNGGWVTNSTISASLTPSTNLTLQGTVTGQAITASPASSISTNTQTIKAGKLTVTRNTLPATANVIVGSDNVLLGSWAFDAADSGEDVRVTTIAIAASSSAATNLRLYANGVAMDPINAKPASTDDGATTTFALSEPLIITKGTKTTVELKGYIESSATANDSSEFGITSNAAVTAYGKSTGNTITVAVSADNGAVLTYLASGTLTISTTANPAAAIVVAGSTGNTMTKVRLQAKNENLDLNTLRIYVADGGVSGATGNYQDVTGVSIYDGSTLIASGTIPAAGYYDFTFAKNTVTIPKGGEKVLTVKADFSTINPDTDNAPGTASADVAIGIGGTDGIKTTGVSSNTEITGATYEIYQASTSSGMVLHVTRPTVTYSTTSSSLGAATKLTNGSVALFAFKVAADAAGEVLLYATSFNITTTTGVTVSALYLKDQDGNTVGASASPVPVAGVITYQPTFNSPVVSNGDLGEALQIPAGSERTYTLWGTVAGADTGDYVATTLESDTTHLIGTAAAQVTATYNFIWSDNVYADDIYGTGTDNATTSSQWYNGTYVNGLVSPTAYTISI